MSLKGGMAATSWTQRLVWFILILSLIIGIVTVIFIVQPDASSCYSYDDVVARLWTCTGRPFDIDSSCCQEVEKDVNKDCGWYTADFCSYFADAANEYCHVNYCPGDRAQIQSAVNNATRSG
ncbi:hypothetical protein MPTK1_5g10870 [Marchantia polymorpha subsp. ruderalis]|uniref:Uncharacterized protein n=2 Tax=Marchantia polymorpha TaxID=3197 RepID=A0AAF6BH34_MARPO|nr:hypothetical protein MARPO_0093s0008 [Marchantia polymorpha]BBN11318.1 hypothetical protein Mp_5g10870 [Marchantia polymorpha subsp. ruderalis]|eukprot:PTQ32924.1 hypothetical protein MARPO_0093s0008 [Marchantia polymorpha]